MRLQLADFRDLAGPDSNVRPIPRQASTVDHHATPDDRIEFCHFRSSWRLPSRLTVNQTRLTNPESLLIFAQNDFKADVPHIAKLPQTLQGQTPGFYRLLR